MSNALMQYTMSEGQVLDAQTVRSYLVNGNGQVTDSEV